MHNRTRPFSTTKKSLKTKSHHSRFTEPTFETSPRITEQEDFSSAHGYFTLQRLGVAPQPRDRAQASDTEQLKRINLEALQRLDHLLVHGDPRRDRKAIQSLERTIWRNEGVLKQGFSQVELDSVSTQLSKAGKIPNGYLYP